MLLHCSLPLSALRVVNHVRLHSVLLGIALVGCSQVDVHMSGIADAGHALSFVSFLKCSGGVWGVHVLV